MPRVHNFSAGPATLPEAVLRQAQEEMLDWRGAGASIVELSHRGPEFIQVAAEAEADLRKLMAIPDDYPQSIGLTRAVSPLRIAGMTGMLMRAKRQVTLKR